MTIEHLFFANALMFGALMASLIRFQGAVIKINGTFLGLMARNSAPLPIPMVIVCPRCHVQHIDVDEWATRPHKTHLCAFCKCQWRPALVPTVGVDTLGGEALKIPSASEAPPELKR